MTARWFGRGYCHYCGRVPTTRDHIVPRELLPSGTDNTYNVVPSCDKCNREKGNQRSDCVCPVCLAAWEMHGPEGWESLPKVRIGWPRRGLTHQIRLPSARVSA